MFLLFTGDYPPVCKSLKLFKFAVATASRYFHSLSTPYCLLSKKNQRSWLQSCLPNHLVKIHSSSWSSSHYFVLFSACIYYYLKWLFSFICLLGYFKDKCLYVEALFCSLIPYISQVPRIVFSMQYIINICEISIKY